VPSGVFFGIPRAAKYGGTKLGEYVITCINLLQISWKKSYHSVFFSLIVMIFFPLERRPVSGVVRKFKCPLKKHGLSAQAVGL
jgi:hypothetical protein